MEPLIFQFTRILALIAAVSAASSTTSECNPLSASSCGADPALATDIAVDFSSKSSYFDVVSTESGVDYSDDGLALSLKKRYDNPSLKSTFYIMFGRVEVLLKAAKGTGIVSTFFLQSDDLDEIDVELLGGDTTQFQSNFFSKGDTTTYDRGEYHSTSGSPQDSFFNYTIDWTDEKIVWYYNGDSVRTLKSTSSEGFPQSPMYLKFGIWAGGDPSNEQGTIEWAGGETDYSDAPFTMYVKKISVSDYSTGDSYSYSDQSGDWESIKAKNGKVNGRVDDAGSGDSGSDSSSSSSSSASSSSSSPSSSSSSSDSSSSSSPSSSSSSSKHSKTTLSSKHRTTTSTHESKSSSADSSESVTSGSVSSDASASASSASEKASITAISSSSSDAESSASSDSSSKSSKSKSSSSASRSASSDSKGASFKIPAHGFLATAGLLVGLLM